MNTLLTSDASAQVIPVEKPLMPHPDAGAGLFASKAIENANVVEI